MFGYMSISDLFLTTIQQTNIAAFVKTFDGKYLFINRPGAEMLAGRTPEEVVGATDFDLFDRHSAELMMKRDAMIRYASGPHEYASVVRLNGTNKDIVFHSIKVPIRINQGNTFALLGLSFIENKNDRAQADLLALMRELAKRPESILRALAGGDGYRKPSTSEPSLQ